jgi:hypothetical protein
LFFKAQDTNHNEWSDQYIKRKSSTTAKRERKTSFANEQGFKAPRKASRSLRHDYNEFANERSEVRQADEYYSRPSIPTERDAVLNARNSIIPSISNRISDNKYPNQNFAWID